MLLFSVSSCLVWVDIVALVILRMTFLLLLQAPNFSSGGFFLELWLASLMVLILLYISSNLDFIFWLITMLHCIPVDRSVEHSVIVQFILTMLKGSLHLLKLFSLLTAFLKHLKNTHSCRIVLITIIHCEKHLLLILNPFCLSLKKKNKTQNQKPKQKPKCL